MSRPKKAVELRRSKIVSCSLTPAAHAALVELANKASMGVSTFTGRVLDAYIQSSTRGFALPAVRAPIVMDDNDDVLEA